MHGAGCIQFPSQKEFFCINDTNFSASSTYLFQEVYRKKERIIVNNKQLHDIGLDKGLLSAQGVTNSVINYVRIYE